MTIEEVKVILAKLGKTDEEIRQSLAEKGIKGYKCDSDNCPLTVYMDSEGVVCPSVSKKYVFFGEYRIQNFESQCFVPSKEFVDFIKKFDNGKYPELVKSHLP